METWKEQSLCEWGSDERGKERKQKPGKDTATITRMASGATGFDVCFVIRLNSIAFGALVTHPLLVITVLPPEVLLDPNKVTKGMTWVMVQTTRLWANKHPLLLPLCCFPFQQLPWHLMPPPVHLKILVSLKPLVADLTHISVWFQQGLWWQRHNLSIWICTHIYIYTEIKTTHKLCFR